MCLARQNLTVSDIHGDIHTAVLLLAHAAPRGGGVASLEPLDA